MREHLSNYRFGQEVSPEVFAHQTDWMLRYYARDQTRGFSLVMIDFHEPTALGNALGAAYAMTLLRRVGREVAEALRSTDLYCRIRVGSFFVLLPQGSPSIVLNKIEPLLATARADGLESSAMRTSMVSVPEDLQGEASALDLFNRLAGRGARVIPA
jgi:GGDEF domain-containing protein